MVPRLWMTVLVLLGCAKQVCSATMATALRRLLGRARPAPGKTQSVAPQGWAAAGVLLACLLSASTPAQALNLVQNGSFETPKLGSGSYQYGPSGTSWTFSGGGLQTNGSAWAAPAAPAGTQTAFLQNVSSITQSVTFNAASSYTIAFRAAQRACCTSPYTQKFQVSVDGVVVGQATPPTGSFASYSYTFQAAAGAHAIAFTTTESGDKSVFIDDVVLTGAPAVSIAAPANDSRFGSGVPIALTAAAAAPSGTIAKVEFFSGATLIGTATQSPYTVNLTNVAPGSYTVTARATDNQGATVTSQPVTVYVEAPPTISLNGPAATPPLVAPASVNLSATAMASGTNNAITQVQFYNGTVLLGSVANAPYNFVRQEIAAGTYSVTAVATDSLGGRAMSNAVGITVWDHPPPTVSVTATPTNAMAPATISLAANAASAGTVASVEFYNGTTLLATVTQAPYAYAWSNVASGRYTLTAKATDNQGAATISSPAMVTVTVSGAPPAQVYFIDSDQLNTPRVVTDEANNPVWKWDSDPFGASLPEQDPGNTGTAFIFNPRFPGQYFDKETGLHYNYFRDYESATGRYLQSDPIGLDGGIDTFSYAYNAPMMNKDPTGLFVDENGAYLGPAAIAASVAAPAVVVAGAAAAAGAATYQLCNGDDDKDKCKKIIAEIYEVMNVVEGRLTDLYVDSLDLYNNAYGSPSPSLRKGSGSYKGHIRQADGWQRKLRDLVDRATKMGCKVPPYARELAYASIPTRPALPVK